MGRFVGGVFGCRKKHPEWVQLSFFWLNALVVFLLVLLVSDCVAVVEERTGTVFVDLDSKVIVGKIGGILAFNSTISSFLILIKAELFFMEQVRSSNSDSMFLRIFTKPSFLSVKFF